MDVRNVISPLPAPRQRRGGPFARVFFSQAAGYALLTLAAALVLWLYVAAGYHKEAVNDISEALITINSYKAGQLHRWLDRHQREAIRLSQHSFLGDVVLQELSSPGSKRAQLVAWLKYFATQDKYSAMAILSPGGATIAATPGYPPWKVKPVTEAFAQAVRSGKPSLTDLYQAADGSPRMALISPIFKWGQAGKTLCVVIALIDPEDDFYPLVKATPLFFSSAETLLVRQEGEKVVFLNKLQYVKNAPLKFTLPLSKSDLPAAAALKGRSGFFEGIDYRGTRVFSALDPFEGSDWSLVTKIDRDEVMAPVKTKQHLALAEILLLSGLIYITVYLLLRYRQKAAEAALAKSSYLLSETEKVGKVGGWELNVDTMRQVWTEEIYRIHELDDMGTQTAASGINFYTPESRPVIENAIQRAIQSGEGFDLELEIITAKGHRRAVHAIGRADLEHRRIYGFFQDITARRRAEEKLRESEQIFREFLDHSPIYVFFKDKDIRPMYLNRNYEAMLGRPVEELLGRSMDELFPSDLAKSMVADDKRVLQAGKEVVVEEELNGRSYRTIKFPIIIQGKPPYLAGYTIDITEQKQAAEKIARVNERLLLAARAAHLGIWDWDIKADRLLWDDRMFELYGLKKEDFHGAYEAWLNGVHPDDRVRCDEAIRQALSGEKEYDIEFRVLLPGGAIRHIKANADVFRDAAGKPNRMVGVNFDVTARKQAEEKLRESEERLRVTLEETRIGTWDWNITEDIWTASPTYFTMLGYAPEYGPSDRKAWLERVHPEDKALVADKIGGVLAGKEGKYQYEARLRHADGTYRWQAVLGTTVKRSLDGKPARMMGVRMDITERKKADEALEQSIHLLDTAGALAKIGGWELDAPAMKLAWSRETYAIHEVGPDFEPSVETAIGFYAPEDQPRIAAAVKAALEKGEPFDLELSLITAKGSRITVQAKGIPESRDGKVFKLWGTFQDVTERRRAENALKKSEKDLKEAQRLARIGSWEWDAVSDRIAWSEEYYRIFGFDPAQPPPGYEEHLKAYTPESAARLDAAVKLGMRTGEPYELDLELSNKEGPARWITARSETVRNAGGKVTGLRGTAQDITERKEIEEKITESELKYRNLFNNAGIGMFRTRLDGAEFLDLNESYCRILGRSRGEILGSPSVSYWYAPEERARMLEILKAKGRVENFECRLVHKDGSIINCLTSLSLYPETGILEGALMDITERKKAEEALRESESLLNESQTIANLGSYVLDVLSDSWTSSAALDGVFGIGEAYDRSIKGWTELVHPADRALMAAYFSGEVVGAARPFDREYRIIRRDTGAERWVHGLGRLELDAHGRPVKMRGTIQDITGSKLAELELERVNRDLMDKKQEMENFLYITTHDLRTPLVNIQGFGQNLEKYFGEIRNVLAPAALPQAARDELEPLTGEYIPKALNFILSSSRKMDALITALLKVSRAGRVEMRPENLDMNGLMETVINSLGFQLTESGGTVKAGPLPPCRADRAAVTQIFTNLLDNAVKYRHKDRAPLITVNGELSGGMARYTVADNGSGIPESELEKIWNVFYRQDRAPSKKGEGIGLPMVKRMAEKNGGSISVLSKAGEGSVFHLALPAGGDHE